MRFLRTNTACRVTVGPFFDKTDGVTPETGLTVTSCKLTLMVDTGNVPTLVIDASATASGGNNDMVHVTGDDAGFYDLELTAAQTNYLGRAILAITDAATHCPVFHEFMIIPAMMYDSVILGTDRLDTNVTHIGDQSQTARDIGASVLLSSGTGTGQVSLSSGLVTLAPVTHTGAVIPGVADLQTRLPAALTGDGMMKSDALYVNGTAQSNGDINLKIDAVKTDTAAIKLVTDDITFTVDGAIDVNIVAWLGYVATVDANNYPFIGSVNTKTGYALTGAYDPAKTAAQATDQTLIKAKTDQLVFTTPNKVDATATATLDQDAIDDIADAVIAGVDMATPNEIAAALTNIGTVELIGPMLTGAAHKIVRGSAYLSAISTAPYVLVAKATYDLTGATAEFRMKLDRQTAVIITASIVSYDATYWKVYADLTASNTDDMTPGTGHDQFWVTLSGGAVVCLSQNYLEVIAGIGVA